MITLRIALGVFVGLTLCGCRSNLDVSRSSSSGLPGDPAYLGQSPPGDEPTVFAPGIVSVRGKNTHAVQFSPDGRMLVFSRYPDGTSFVMTRSAAGWTNPQPTSFRGKEVSFDAATHRLFYYDDAGDLNFVRYGSNGFSQPTALPSTVNTPKTEYYPCVTAKRNLFFSRGSHWRRGRISVVRLEGDGFGRTIDLGAPINTGSALHGFVAPDESYMVFNSPRPGSYTQNDLWVSFRNPDESWDPPVNLGERINCDAKAVICPTVSPDGKYLFFTRLQRDGTGYIYWADARVIDRLRNGKRRRS